MRNLIIWFEDIDKDCSSLVGSKAANLGKMVQAGFTVPPGFCLTVEAYRLFLNRFDIEKELKKLVHGLNSSDLTHIQTISLQIQDIINSFDLPEEVVEAVEKAYHKLCDEGSANIAVRSSATLEDLPTSSFAGQYETFLNVSKLHDVLDKIKKSWASLWSRRAIAYRLKNSFDHFSANLAIIFQRMIPAEISGVTFTVNPLNNNWDELVINAGHGLGEGIVSGIVSPDTYIMSKKRWKVQNRSKSIKDNMVVCVPSSDDKNGTNATNVELVPKNIRKNYVLTNRQILKVAELGANLEKHCEAPQDVEWCIHNQTLYVLQTRSITTLNNFVIEVDNKEDLRYVWSRKKMEVPCPNPYTPFWGDITSEWIGKGASMAMKNLGLPLALPIRCRLINGYMYALEPKKWITPKVLGMPFKFLRAIRTEYGDWERMLPEYKSEIERLKAVDLSFLSLQELYQHLLECIQNYIGYGKWEIRVSIVRNALFGMFSNMVKKMVVHKEELLFTELLLGLNNQTIFMNEKIKKLSRLIYENSELRAIFMDHDKKNSLELLEKEPKYKPFFNEFKSFLDQEGHRASYEDGIYPTWEEDPEIALILLQKSLLYKNFDVTNKESLVEKRNRAVEFVLENITGRFKNQRAYIFKKALKYAQLYFPFAEQSEYYLYLGRKLLRMALLELENRLMECGLFKSRLDIFYLRRGELDTIINDLIHKSRIDVGSLCPLLEERKAAREEQFKAAPPEQVNNKNAFHFKQKAKLKGDVLKGVPGSSGIISGKARIIKHPDEFYLIKRGEILVSRTITPVWTTLFGIVKGIVVDTGGALSHGAIVAREFGIPAVMGTTIGTEVIKSGNVVSVDGTNGTVTLTTN